MTSVARRLIRTVPALGFEIPDLYNLAHDIGQLHRFV
jgi:hypothetical protein